MQASIRVQMREKYSIDFFMGIDYILLFMVGGVINNIPELPGCHFHLSWR